MTRTTISSTSVNPFSLLTIFFFTKTHHSADIMRLLYHIAPPFRHTYLVYFAVQSQQTVVFRLFCRRSAMQIAGRNVLHRLDGEQADQHGQHIGGGLRRVNPLHGKQAG